MNLKEQLDRNTMLSHVILGLASEGKISELADKGFDSTDAEVVITINGVEVVSKTFNDIFDYLWSALEREYLEPNKENITKMAKELLKERVSALNDKLYEVEQTLDWKLDDLLQSEDV